MTRRVAIATCAEVPDLDEDGPVLVAELRRRSVEAVPAVWDDSSVDWDGFDLVVVRSTWDYPERRDEFLGWADGLRRVLNPPHVLRWNTDKRYLEDVARAGVRIVPTRFLEPGAPFEPPPGAFVVKPAVGAGSRGAAAYEAADVERARCHVARLHSEGRAVMVQPYLTRIEERGETALVYVGGRYSHAVWKAPLLAPGAPPGDALYVEETIEPRKPAAEERAAGDLVVSSLPFRAADLLYARVDLLPDADRGTVVLEVELTEPSLFLAYEPGAAGLLADAIALRLAE